MISFFVDIFLPIPLFASTLSMGESLPNTPKPGSAIYVGDQARQPVRQGVTTEKSSIQLGSQSHGSSCAGIGDSAVCLVRGPAFVRLTYEGNEKTREYENGQNTLCYAGPNGLFCEDDENESDAYSKSQRNEFIYNQAPEGSQYKEIIDNSRRVGFSIGTLGGGIDFEKVYPATRCMNDAEAVICHVRGPVRLRLTYLSSGLFADRFMKVKTRDTFCYAGRHGLFCDNGEEIIEID